ncbi:MAG: hypothetical protein KBC41_00045 [Candidatus Pacebacteria bacterium]|nr:hypothetical protein [Candidatus Paceibacterota bacterium]MBP9866458.1 hypothetical protein [Candidatus Paceibacterota bacterium]
MKHFLYKKRIGGNLRRGYIALISVIVIGAIGVAIMLSIMLSGISTTKTDFAVQQSGSAKVLASSCGEEALQKILETGTTSSSVTIAIGEGTCSYTITSQSGQNITIQATALIGTITSKVKIVIATTTPAILLSSWQEVGDF